MAPFEDGMSGTELQSEGVRSPWEDGVFWSHRDSVVEDEVINNGAFADTVFLCASDVPPHHVEQVFGQAALFALLSPVLRDRLDLSADPGCGRGGPSLSSAAGLGRSSSPRNAVLAGLGRDRPGLREVWLADEITARAFREVARYVYRLPLRLCTLKLAEVTMAARILQMPELDQAAFQWGHANLENFAFQRGARPMTHGADGPEEGLDGTISNAVSFFGVLCLPVGGDGLNTQARCNSAMSWRQALMKAFNSEEIASHPTFLELPEEAMLLLLECEEIHARPGHLWKHCVQWAWVRKERELPITKSAAWCTGPSFEKPPKKLYVPGARLVAVSAPQPAEHEVDWQRWLLAVAERMRFKDMQAAEFAAHMEAINPMLPELRQVIYRVRRQGIHRDTAGDSVSTSQRLYVESE